MGDNNRMKRRSSFFRRDLEPEDESMSTTSSETTNSSEHSSANNHQNEDTIREEYIKNLKAEQKAWKQESNRLKEQYLKMKKESKNSLVKTSKSDLYAMLTEKEKQEYAILFSGSNHSSLLDAMDELKKRVALVSIKSEHNAFLITEHLKRNKYQSQARFENLMNLISAKDSASEELPWDSEGESISDCLDSDCEGIDL